MKKDRQGFTLIELMIVVAILGILAAIAIPTFILFVNRSKTAEASSNIKNMFTAVTAYYQGEITGKAINSASTSGYCTVGSAGPSPATPTDEKQTFDSTDFVGIGFHIADSVYFSYSLVSAGGQCSNTANNLGLYTIVANGDLDADAVLSTFELAVGSDGSNTLYHSRGLFISNEMD